MIKNKIIDNEIMLYLSFILIIVMILMRDVFQIDLNKYVFLLFIIFFTVFMLDLKNSIAFLCFLIPFLSGLPANYIVIYFCFLILFKGGLKFKLNIFIPLVLFLILETIHVFFLTVHFFDLIMYSSYLILIMLLLFMKNNIDVPLCIKSFSIGSLSTFACILYISLQYIPFSDILLYRYGKIQLLTNVDRMILTHDQNFIGYLSIVGISSLVFLSGCKISNNKRETNFNFLLIAGLLFFGLLTLSRAFILTLLIYIVLYLFSIIRLLKGNNFKYLIMFLLLLFFFYIFISIFFPDIIDSIIKRFTTEEFSGGRSVINSFYFNAFIGNLQYILIGTGILTMMTATNYFTALHNSSLQLLIGTGIFGTIIFIILFYNVLKNEVKKLQKKLTIKTIIPLLVSIIITQSIPTFNPYYGLLPLILPLLTIRLNDKTS